MQRSDCGKASTKSTRHAGVARGCLSTGQEDGGGQLSGHTPQTEQASDRFSPLGARPLELLPRGTQPYGGGMPRGCLGHTQDAMRLGGESHCRPTSLPSKLGDIEAPDLYKTHRMA